MNVKFLMKFLSIVLIHNTFFCMQYLNASESIIVSEEEERLLGGNLLQAIECNQERQEEQRTEKSEAVVKKIPLNGSLKESMQFLSRASDKEKGDFFFRTAHQHYLSEEGLPILSALNLIEAADYYANDQDKNLFVKKIFNFIQSHRCYRDCFPENFREFVESRRKKILKE